MRFTQDQVLLLLKEGDSEAVEAVMTVCGPELLNYCVIRTGNYMGSKELVANLFKKWLATGFANATFPLFAWMMVEADAECYRLKAGLN